MTRTKNIVLDGVGGQGLVLTTRILAQAALKAGLDVKTNDVVGLAQRGGTIWGTVRMGEKVHSPNIEAGSADILLAFEALEAKRMLHYLKQDGLAVVNRYQMAPTKVQQEEREYDEDIFTLLEEKSRLIALDATSEGKKLGHPAIANILMLGIAAKELPIDDKSWEEAIRENVPEKFIELNLQAFQAGLNW